MGPLALAGIAGLALLGNPLKRMFKSKAKRKARKARKSRKVKRRSKAQKAAQHKASAAARDARRLDDRRSAAVEAHQRGEDSGDYGSYTEDNNPRKRRNPKYPAWLTRAARMVYAAGGEDSMGYDDALREAGAPATRANIKRLSDYIRDLDAMTSRVNKNLTAGLRGLVNPRKRRKSRKRRSRR